MQDHTARPTGSWPIPDIDFGAIFNRFDTLLVGRKTFAAMQEMGGGGGTMPGVEAVVLPRTMRPSDHPDVTIVSEAAPFVTALKAKPGKDIWLFGGGTLFRVGGWPSETDDVCHRTLGGARSVARAHP